MGLIFTFSGGLTCTKILGSQFLRFDLDSGKERTVCWFYLGLKYGRKKDATFTLSLFLVSWRVLGLVTRRLVIFIFSVDWYNLIHPSGKCLGSWLQISRDWDIGLRTFCLVTGDTFTKPYTVIWNFISEYERSDDDSTISITGIKGSKITEMRPYNQDRALSGTMYSLAEVSDHIVRTKNSNQFS